MTDKDETIRLNRMAARCVAEEAFRRCGWSLRTVPPILSLGETGFRRLGCWARVGDLMVTVQLCDSGGVRRMSVFDYDTIVLTAAGHGQGA